MVLGFHSGVINEHPGVSDDATHGASTVSVELYELLRLGGFHELGSQLLLDSEDNSGSCLDTDGCGSVVDSFKSIFDLVDSAFWRECVDTTIVVLLAK